MVGAGWVVVINGLVYHFPGDCWCCDHEIYDRGACAIVVVVGWYIGDIDEVLSMVLDKYHYLVCMSMASHL
jgi:hypothetical protein